MASPSRIEKIKNVVSKRQQGLVVVLEDIHDPHNAEAVFRSCDALGVQEVYLIFDQEKPFNPRKVGKKSSSSANKWLTFHTFTSRKECFATLREKGYHLIATALSAKAKDLFTTSFEEKRIAVMVGNEHRGLSKEALGMADSIVTIPMHGMVESFNVSVATTVFLFEITRQRRNQDYSLSASDQINLVEDFTTRSSKRKY